MSKGAPQGSLFGPFAYNLFTNDLIILIKSLGLADICNYADDNTISCYDKSVDVVTARLTQVSDVTIQWFKTNFMQANPNKFQLILFGSDHVDKSININGNTLSAEPHAKANRESFLTINLILVNI